MLRTKARHEEFASKVFINHDLARTSRLRVTSLCHLVPHITSLDYDMSDIRMVACVDKTEFVKAVQSIYREMDGF